MLDGLYGLLTSHGFYSTASALLVEASMDASVVAATEVDAALTWEDLLQMKRNPK